MEKASIDPYKGIVFYNSFQIKHSLPQILNSYFFIIRRYILEISSNGHIWAFNQLPFSLYIFLIIEEDWNAY